MTASTTTAGNNATAAAIAASGAPTTLAIDSANDAIDFTFQGTEYTGAIAQAAYGSQALLEAALQSAIDASQTSGSVTLGANKITVGDTGGTGTGAITLTDASGTTGVASSITFNTASANDAAANLNLTGQTATGAAATHAVVTGSTTGPITFTASNNMLKLDVDVNGTTTQQDVTFANGSTSMLSVASQINTQVGSNIASVNNNGNLVLTSIGTGANNGFTSGAANNEFSGATLLGLTGATVVQGSNSFTIANTNDQLTFSVDGGANQTVTVASGSYASAANLATAIQTALANASITGVTASSNAAGNITLSAANGGSNHSLQVVAGGLDDISTTLGLGTALTSGTSANVGFGSQGSSFRGNTQGAAPGASQDVDSSGAYQVGASAASGLISFSALANGSDDQTIDISTIGADGAINSSNIVLKNNTTDQTGATIDSALNAINGALQASGNAALQSITAVKYNNAGTEQIKFLSASTQFSLTLGSTADGSGLSQETTVNNSPVYTQGTTLQAAVTGTGSTADISTVAGADAALSALSAAVQILGSAQAAVGKGENLLNYATTLAQSENTNDASAESQIRDANLAQEAANLTKAQILVQAGTAALAQANSAPQTLLSLLQH